MLVIFQGIRLDGKGLYERIISTIQEMYLKIGDTQGSVSLYYPYSGDVRSLTEEYRAAAEGILKEVIIEELPERIRIVVPEECCKLISRMPVRDTMEFVIGLIKERASMESFEASVMERYPSAKITDMTCLEFDKLLTFPEDTDSDCYCLTSEAGVVSYHRFSREDFLAFGFELPK